MPADPAATPVGARNLACAPGPSVLPSSPVPATVLTVRDASVPIKRIRLLRVSATITCPVAVTARPVGPENWAAGPGPSAGAAEPTTPRKHQQTGPIGRPWETPAAARSQTVVAGARRDDERAPVRGRFRSFGRRGHPPPSDLS